MTTPLLMLDTLIPMQDQLRENDQVPGMIQFIREGNRWSDYAVEEHTKAVGKRLAPIYITKFPDGKLMIHDGHHRVVATLLAGRHFLYPEEYLICEWTYDAYDEIWFDRGYVTPHNPITEVRLPDFIAFKRHAVALATTDPDAARRYILDNKPLYARPRKVWNLAELAQDYQKTYQLVSA